MSTIKVNKILSANNPVVDVADGLTVTGEVKVASAVTSNSTGIDVTGIVTATSFEGSGANLTGIDATSIKHTDGSVKVQAINTGANLTGNLSVSGNLGVAGVLTYEDVTNVDSVGVITARDGLRVTGIATVNALEIENGTTSVNKHSVGIGTTTTAGRNAGVSTATGTIIYNSTLNKVQIYVDNEWKNFKIDLGPLTLSYLVIGGGGAGGGGFRSGGGGAGAYRTNWNNENQGGGQSSGAAVTLNPGTAYSVVVGAGGGGVNDAVGNAGSQSKFDNITADGGGGGGGYESNAPS